MTCVAVFIVIVVLVLVMVMMIKSGRISREEEIEFYRRQRED
jgi:hypothetical protein